MACFDQSQPLKKELTEEIVENESNSSGKAQFLSKLDNEISIALNKVEMPNTKVV
jgi:hypothetical protein